MGMDVRSHCLREWLKKRQRAESKTGWELEYLSPSLLELICECLINWPVSPTTNLEI